MFSRLEKWKKDSTPWPFPTRPNKINTTLVFTLFLQAKNISLQRFSENPFVN
jgi:hypothetical protein